MDELLGVGLIEVGLLMEEGLFCDGLMEGELLAVVLVVECWIDG